MSRPHPDPDRQRARDFVSAGNTRKTPPEPVPARPLDDGCFELRVSGCIPAVLTADTYFGNTALQHWQIARVLGVLADCVGLPAAKGRFIETGREFVYEPPPSHPEARRVRVPSTIVVPGEWRRQLR